MKKSIERKVELSGTVTSFTNSAQLHGMGVLVGVGGMGVSVGVGGIGVSVGVGGMGVLVGVDGSGVTLKVDVGLGARVVAVGGGDVGDLYAATVSSDALVRTAASVHCIATSSKTWVWLISWSDASMELQAIAGRKNTPTRNINRVHDLPFIRALPYYFPEKNCHTIQAHAESVESNLVIVERFTLIVSQFFRYATHTPLRKCIFLSGAIFILHPTRLIMNRGIFSDVQGRKDTPLLLLFKRKTGA